jgi:hypothetical protein
MRYVQPTLFQTPCVNKSVTQLVKKRQELVFFAFSLLSMHKGTDSYKITAKKTQQFERKEEKNENQS